MKNKTSLVKMLRPVATGSVLALGIAGQAFADTVSLNAGPILIPSAPVTLCVNAVCAAAPALTSVALSLSITNSPLSGLFVTPTITPGLCPVGQVGIVLNVAGGIGTETISGTLSGTIGTLTYTKTIGPLSLSPQTHGATVSACAF